MTVSCPTSCPDPIEANEINTDIDTKIGTRSHGAHGVDGAAVLDGTVGVYGADGADGTKPDKRHLARSLANKRSLATPNSLADKTARTVATNNTADMAKISKTTNTAETVPPADMAQWTETAKTPKDTPSPTPQHRPEGQRPTQIADTDQECPWQAPTTPEWPTPSPTRPSPPAPRRVTKLETLISRLAAPEGASIAALCEATGWQAHSVRGAIAGTLKRKGFVIVSEKAGSGPRRYAIKAAP